MALYINPHTFSGTITSRPGPRTPGGKAVAARNATTHGLFARDVVLPALGEDPEAFDKLYMTLCLQVEPQNLLERHYVEAICAASWRLRRLHRWQAQVYEDPALTEDERLDKLDRVLRHETALHRQIDKAVRMLARDVPDLFGRRARQRALADLDETERSCRADIRADAQVAERAREHLQVEGLPPGFDYHTLDNTHPVPEAPKKEDAGPAAAKKCQNEPTDEEEERVEEELTPAQGPNDARAAGITPPPAHEFAKTNPPPTASLPPLSPEPLHPTPRERGRG